MQTKGFSQGNRIVNVESHGRVSTRLEFARFTVDKMLSKPDAIEVTPSSLKKAVSLSNGQESVETLGTKG